MKKILLSLGTLTVVATPIVAVVSCSGRQMILSDYEIKERLKVYVEKGYTLLSVYGGNHEDIYVDVQLGQAKKISLNIPTTDPSLNPDYDEGLKAGIEKVTSIWLRLEKDLKEKGENNE